MSNYPDDFAATAQGSPYADSMTAEATAFFAVVDQVNAAKADVDEALDHALAGDDCNLTDFDTERLRTALTLLQQVKAAINEVERNRG